MEDEYYYDGFFETFIEHDEMSEVARDYSHRFQQDDEGIWAEQIMRGVL